MKISYASLLSDKISSRAAVIGVIGLGYVGLPLASTMARGKFRVCGFDVDEQKVTILNKGNSYIDAVSSEELAGHIESGLFHATTNFDELLECDVIIICVPTPLSKQREPDLSYVAATAETIKNRLRPGQAIILESTTYPGTTIELLKPVLEATGLKSGQDFWLGFSPEREDPGNKNFHTISIPKVVSGDGSVAREIIKDIYDAAFEKVVSVSSPSTAEAVKITENVFRAVNIALVNELKVIFSEMDIDIWEVIDAAATKPFGFMPFYPGPGLGGHYIPIDPFYLTWKSREFGLPTRFIELAGEINLSMPRYVIANLEKALDYYQSVSLGNARVLLLGLAYKKNVSDIRESPAFALMEILTQRGTSFDYHDPYVPEIPMTREHSQFAGNKGVTLTPKLLKEYNAVLVCTDHDTIDYQMIADHAELLIDTRNAFKNRRIDVQNLVKT